MIPQIDFLQATSLLKVIIEENVNEKELEWVKRQEDKFRNAFELRSFYIAFSSASRYIRKIDLSIMEEVVTKADFVRKGFQPQSWNLLQCVRTYLLIMLPRENAEVYVANLNKLHESADVDEQVTLYSALPLLPYPERISQRATEGIRTNITTVFDAIALDNPYPADFLEEAAWNQMVLKAVFMERPLYRIYGAHERANPELAEMLIDFAHERWAAGRKVLPELWRFIGLFLSEATLTDIKKVIKGDPLEQEAGLLACANSTLPEAQRLLDEYPAVKKDIESGLLNWTVIGEEYQVELQK